MMMRTMMCMLAATLLMRGGGALGADRETVYQQTLTDGAISLTNVPDDTHRYQVLLSGTAAATASGATAGANSATASVQPRQEDAPLPESAQTAEAPRLAMTPPSIEARTGKRLTPQAASAAAESQARQSQEEIVAAGGAQARLLNLYQASMSAFQNNRPPTQPQR